MDNILAKHLANTLLFPHQEEIETIDENNIQFSSYKIIDGKYYVKINNEVIISSVKGYWNNKPVITFNEQRYALLENSKSLVNLNTIGVKDIQSALTEEVEEIIEPVRAVKTKTEPQTNNTANYLKASSNAQKPKADSSIDNDFFTSLEQHKDDPRVKKFFSYHTDLAKKELFQITEKFTQQQMARAMESGGGTNAVQYANGGVMKGNLIIDGNLSVTGKMNEGTADNDVAAKRVFIIGDNVSKEYTVLHNLDTKNLVVSLYNSQDEQVMAGVKNITLNETKISFSNAISLSAIKVVIIG